MLVKMSPSPPSSPRKISLRPDQEPQTSSFIDTQSIEQQSSFLSSRSQPQRSRPVPVLSPYERTQSLTRNDNYRRIQQYPKTLEIFIPTDKDRSVQSTVSRSYEYEVKENRRPAPAPGKSTRTKEFDIEREYVRCLNDVVDEFDKRYGEKTLVDQGRNTKTHETREHYENFEEIRRYPQVNRHVSNRVDNQTTYQRSLSEGLLHQRSKPLASKDITISDEDLWKIEHRLHPKERLKPIHIHTSNSSIPGETSIKYVRAERIPVEILLPKPQLVTTQGEHSSTVVKDVRHSTRKVTTNIHQPERRKTIEGEHELRIIEKPISSGETRPVEFTVPKPLESFPVEHSSTLVVKSKKGGRFHTLDISSTLTREHTLSGEHELRVISEPIRSHPQNKPVELVFPKPTLSSSSSHHTATIVKQTRAPKSSLTLDNIQTTLKGEHQFRLVDKPIQAGPGQSVELIVPKSVTDVAEHTTTLMTETQPHRRVLEITGSGKAIQAEHERKFFSDVVRVEEAVEVKLPKRKIEQVEHSATIVKHSRGHQPIIEIDSRGKTMVGEHQTKIVQESIETTADAMHLLVAKPRLPAEHSTTVVKGARGRPQVLTFDHTQPIPGKSISRSKSTGDDSTLTNRWTSNKILRSASWSTWRDGDFICEAAACSWIARRWTYVKIDTERTRSTADLRWSSASNIRRTYLDRARNFNETNESSVGLSSGIHRSKDISDASSQYCE